MKKKILSLIAITASIFTAQAQGPWRLDSVQIGTGSNTYDYHYSMQNGMRHVNPTKDYHIAFAMNATDSTAIWANHQNGNAFVKVYNIHKDSTQWSTVTLADTATATMCYNNDQNWAQGAFNAIPNADPFNFGWGHYVGAPTHNIMGDSIFIVKANGVFYKFFIEKYNSLPPISYTFSVENLTVPAPATQYTINKTPIYDTCKFAYFNLATSLDASRECNKANWDILFTRYTTDAVGSGQGTNNNVLGVLQNSGVTVAEALQIHIDTALVNYATYTPSAVISTIGYDWKMLTSIAPIAYDCRDSISYFVKDVNSNLWQMQFLSYNAAVNGTIQFRIRQVYPTAVSNVNSIVSSYTVFPNPSASNLNVVLDSKENTNATIYLTDIAGKTILQTNQSIKTGVNAFTLQTANLPIGNYMMKIQGNNINLSEKVSIAK